MTTTGGRAAVGGVSLGRIAISIGEPNISTPDGFRWTALSAVARLESGHTPSRKHAHYWDGDIPWVGVRDATGNHGLVIDDTAQHVTQAGIDNSSARVLPEGTVCLSRTASVGYVVTLGRPMATSQDFVNWVCGPDLDPRYLHYVLMLEQESIRRFARGTTHQTMYYPEAKALHALLPSRPQQTAIADVLRALDDKIAANRTVIDRADDLARVMYASASAASGVQVPLSSLAQFVNGKAFTKDATGTGRVVIRIAELNSGLGGSTVRNDLEVADQHVARAGDLLFAWSGSLTVHRWFRDEAIVNQHIFKVIPAEGVPMWVVNGAVRLKLREFQAIAADKATTMGHIQRRHLDEPVAVPSETALASLSDKMTSLWERALSAEMENERLAATRDALLPLLMSGKVRVKDAEATVGEMV
ncbi:restriction endonuclease subunit S [Luteipulveratus flavus]|uniref:Restriction endonuclease subunit S n=1 Tax=Luteipulveratus flavus TaxID=3031728 RepID=A0ABT6C4I3_9MICO|nr:restriction endonuclease subunit S [Luteipulveratus sp. YIM 133296]MDF8263738.1 restriction endonuclease subunit S [Luteipulveratus sp. YIM 133296]